ncbi:Hypothetical predicted protein [Cloeon dipterum]|uniref:Reverse transcriptase domain-containing protein n=1 Tax=Cloeon dipterum TaxID=197152 RepID=A0A8S1CLS4_9INSE|nr:Hypothetical predicted protein [Cloeon dipterum]
MWRFQATSSNNTPMLLQTRTCDGQRYRLQKGSKTRPVYHLGQASNDAIEKKILRWLNTNKQRFRTDDIDSLWNSFYDFFMTDAMAPLEGSLVPLQRSTAVDEVDVKVVQQELKELLRGQDKHVADLLCDYFSSSLGLKIRCLKRGGKSFNTDVEMAEFANSELKQTMLLYAASDPGPGKPERMQRVVTEDMVLEAIENIKESRKSSGLLLITQKMLTLAPRAMAAVLYKFYDKSLREKSLPADWLNSVITLAHKDTDLDPTLVDNYRPIGITCVPSKILESLVGRHLQQCMERQWSRSQHGNRPKFSTETLLVTALEEIRDDLQRYGRVDCLRLDFSKAGERVMHSVLISKLERLGVDATTVGWVRAFLRGRKQCVRVGNAISSFAEVTCGLPQGSPLSSVLLTIYLNDLSQGPSRARLYQYCDDTLIAKAITQHEDGQELQWALDWVQHWMNDNHMTVSSEKCQAISFQRTNQRRASTLKVQYWLDGNAVPVVPHIKFLGLHLSCDQTWDKHAKSLLERWLPVAEYFKKLPAKQKAVCYELFIQNGLEKHCLIWGSRLEQANPKLFDRIDRIRRDHAANPSLSERLELINECLDKRSTRFRSSKFESLVSSSDSIIGDAVAELSSFNKSSCFSSSFSNSSRKKIAKYADGSKLQRLFDETLSLHFQLHKRRMAAPTKVYKFSMADKGKLRKLLTTNLKEWERSFSRESDADTMVQLAKEGLEELIVESVDKTVPSSFKKHRKESHVLTLEEKQELLKRMFEQEPNEEDAFDRAVQFLHDEVKGKPPINKLITPKGKVIKDAQEIATYFNLLWSQPTSKDDEILQIEIIKPEKCVEFKLDIQMIEERIALLPSNKSHGSFDVSNEMIKLDATAIAPFLFRMYQIILKTRNIPEDWLHSTVIPAYKGKGEVTSEDNYRPISLSPPLGRLLEHIIGDYLNDVLKELFLLHVRQHGHRKGFSNESQLACFREEVSLFTRSGSQVDCVKVDLKAATNFVNHRLLLNKLKCLPIDRTVYVFIKTFLIGHTQTVKVKGAVSPILDLRQGLPQGSPLTNPLFLIYINSIFTALRNKSRIRGFGDDLLVYKEIKNKDDQYSLQEDLYQLEKYIHDHGLKANKKKVQTITFYNPDRCKKENLIMREYLMFDAKVTRVSHLEYLGVTLSFDLTPYRHVINLIDKHEPTLDLYMELVKLIPAKFKRRIYIHVLRPKLEICSSIWGLRSNYSDDDLFARLERVQQKWAAFILETPFHSQSWHPSWKANRAKLGWDSLHARRLMAQLHLMHKIFNRENCLREMVHMEKKQLKDGSYQEMRKDMQSVLARGKTAWRRMVLHVKENQGHLCSSEDELMRKVIEERDNYCRYVADCYEDNRPSKVKNLMLEPTETIEKVARTSPFGIHHLLSLIE